MSSAYWRSAHVGQKRESDGALQTGHLFIVGRLRGVRSGGVRVSSVERDLQRSPRRYSITLLNSEIACQPCLSLRGRCLDAEPVGGPVEDPLLEPDRAEPLLAEERHSFDGEHAVRAAAVRDDLLPLRQVSELLHEVWQRYRDGAGDVACFVFLRGPDVEQRHISRADAATQRRLVDLLELGALGEELSLDALHLREPRLGHPSEGEEELRHLRIGEPARDEEPLLVRLDEPRGSKDLQVLRGVREAHVREPREDVDRARSLREQIDELDPVRTRERLGYARELLVDGVLEAATRCRSWHASPPCTQLLA